MREVDTHKLIVRVVGDNLAVIRYCAGMARLRRIEMQAHLEEPLSALAASTPELV